jgi:hypothetical protein
VGVVVVDRRMTCEVDGLPVVGDVLPDGLPAGVGEPSDRCGLSRAGHPFDDHQRAAHSGRASCRAASRRRAVTRHDAR